MSFFVFYAVRFSPAPELGEWLNVAVVGEGITERKAGVVVTESMQRIEAAFGADAVERVNAICRDLTNLVATMESAHDRGEETQPIPTAMRDQALSLSFSERIVVFEGTFDEALTSVAAKYLSSVKEARSLEAQVSSNQADSESDAAGISNSLQNTIAKIKNVLFPGGIAKSLEQGQRAIESIVHSPGASTVMVIGDDGHLAATLVPKLLEHGKNVRSYDPSAARPTVVEIANPNASRGITVADIAKHAGVSTDSVTQVLHGATEILHVSPKTAERIRDIAGSLGYRADNQGSTQSHSDSLATSMEGVDTAIYIGECHDSEWEKRAVAFTQAAKTGGAKRFVFVGPWWIGQNNSSDVEKEMCALGDDAFAVTIVRLGELYGHAKTAEWFGDLYDPSGQIQTGQSVNVLTANALHHGRASVVDSGPHPFLHVDDAVASIIAVSEAPAQTVNGQVYDIGAEDQIRTFGEIADLIKQQIPNAEIEISAGQGRTMSELVFSKIASELGFAPSLTIEEGIAQLIAALEDGRVAKYLAECAAKAETHPTVVPAGHSTSEIQWDSLTRAPVETKKLDASSDQSIQQH